MKTQIDWDCLLEIIAKYCRISDRARTLENADLDRLKAIFQPPGKRPSGRVSRTAVFFRPAAASTESIHLCLKPQCPLCQSLEIPSCSSTWDLPERINTMMIIVPQPGCTRLELGSEKGAGACRQTGTKSACLSLLLFLCRNRSASREGEA